MASRFSEGQNVLYRGTCRVGTVNKVIKGTRSFQYKITIDGKTRVVAERFLEAVVGVEESVNSAKMVVVMLNEDRASLYA